MPGFSVLVTSQVWASAHARHSGLLHATFAAPLRADVVIAIAAVAHT
ncbi:MAG: hypothetical protein WB808_13465 [Candidatus Dormiibacterota bacterium]